MFYYYGGKRSIVDLYPRPMHPVIVEPFAGGAAYAVHHLVRGNADSAILIEKDPRVAALWQRLLAMTPDEVRTLPIPEAGSTTSDFLYMTAATSNAVSRCRQMTVTTRMPEIIRSMLRRAADVLPYLAGRVEVRLGDYTDAPDVEATWFVDPPYQPHPVKANSARTSYPQGMGYAKGCDSASIDFADLAAWCKERKGQVIAVEQDGADWLPFRPLISRQDSLGVKKREVVWLGGSSHVPTSAAMNIHEQIGFDFGEVA
jgi:site-specific DNA-adenine methylase